MVYSVQQIKFEFLSYIKEFGGSTNEWRVGTGTDPEVELFEAHSIDRKQDIWLWKPMLSPAAAIIVLRYFVDKFGISKAEYSAAGSVVYLFRKTEQTLHK